MRCWRSLAIAGVLALILACAQSAIADPVGQITEFSAGPGSHGFGSDSGMAPGPDGNLWFTDRDAIGRITPDGQITEFSDGVIPGNQLAGITAGADGNLWFADVSAPAIGRITPDGQITEFSDGLNSGSSPGGLALGPDGNVWFTDRGAIGRITPDGQITEFSNGLNPGSDPDHIAQGPDGNMWFTDHGSPSAIGQITPDGTITEFSNGLNPGSDPIGIAPGPDGNVWFTDPGSPISIGRITPSGTITEFSLPPGYPPTSIATGPDGNLWFGGFNGPPTTGPPPIGRITPQGQITYFRGTQGYDQVSMVVGSDGNVWFTDYGVETPTLAIGRIGTGSAPAVPPTLAGNGQVGSPETCHDGQWTTWAGTTPSSSAYPFDGYRWLRDGVAIAGATAQSYTPTSDDVGHQLACRIVATYPVPFLVTVTAVSAPVGVVTAPPAIRGLRVLPKKFVLNGRRAGSHCVQYTRANRMKQRCERPIRVRVIYHLSMPARVSFSIARELTGRRVHARCVAVRRANRHHAHCVRTITIGRKIIRAGRSGNNSFTFTGSIGRIHLGPGTYQLTATPTAGGHIGKQQRVTFRITR